MKDILPSPILAKVLFCLFLISFSLWSLSEVASAAKVACSYEALFDNFAGPNSGRSDTLEKVSSVGLSGSVPQHRNCKERW